METIEIGECQVCHSRCDSRSQCFRNFLDAKLHEDEEKNKELLATEHAKVERYWDAVEAKLARDARWFNRLMGAAVVAIVVVCIAVALLATRGTAPTRSSMNPSSINHSTHAMAATREIAAGRLFSARS